MKKYIGIDIKIQENDLIDCLMVKEAMESWDLEQKLSQEDKIKLRNCFMRKQHFLKVNRCLRTWYWGVKRLTSELFHCC